MKISDISKNWGEQLLDNADEAVPMNQASQILQNPHLPFLPVPFLVIYTVEKTEYHGKTARIYINYETPTDAV